MPVPVDYPALAWNLLQRGDTPMTVIAFLCHDYGLDGEQARAAIILAKTMPEERSDHSVIDDLRARSGPRRQTPMRVAR